MVKGKATPNTERKKGLRRPFDGGRGSWHGLRENFPPGSVRGRAERNPRIGGGTAGRGQGEVTRSTEECAAGEGGKLFWPGKLQNPWVVRQTTNARKKGRERRRNLTVELEAKGDSG